MKPTFPYKVLSFFLITIFSLAGHAASNIDEGIEAFNSRNYRLAYSLLLPLAEAGDAKAAGYIARLFFNGAGTPKDFIKAESFARVAVAAEDSNGQIILGMNYRDGRTLKRDYVEAKKWFEKAAQQSNPRAYGLLCHLSINGFGETKSYEKGLENCKKGADLGDTVSIGNLGWLYRNGYGLEKDYKQAIKWFEVGALKKDSFCQRSMGDMYYNGFGVEKDYVESAHWYQLAAAQDDAAAQNSLGWQYLNGLGIAQSNEDALKWFRLAAAQGNDAAQNNLDKLSSLIRDEKQNSNSIVSGSGKDKSVGELANTAAAPAQQDGERSKLLEIVNSDLYTGTYNHSTHEEFKKHAAAAKLLLLDEKYKEINLQWLKAYPLYAIPLFNLAALASQQRKYEESIGYDKQLIELKNDVNSIRLGHIQLSTSLISAGRTDEANAELDKYLKDVKWDGASGFANVEGAGTTPAIALYNKARIAASLGNYAQSIDLSSHSIEFYKAYLESSKVKTNESIRRSALIGMIGAMRQRVGNLTKSQQYGEAESFLRDSIVFSKENAVESRYIAGLETEAGTLHFEQKNFKSSILSFQQADKIWQSLGYSELSPERIAISRTQLQSLAILGKWDEAYLLIEQIDKAVEKDPKQGYRGRLNLQRAVTYIGSNTQLGRAAELLESGYSNVIKNYPVTHVLAAEEIGMAGVARWKIGDDSNRKIALKYLKQSVNDYMRVENQDLNSTGFGKMLREMVFSFYLQATFTLDPSEANRAMVPADWIRGGSVQQAVAQAAIRSSVTDPKLSGLIRTLQDGKNELDALRSFVSDEDAKASVAEDVLVDKRNRIVELERVQIKLLTDIRTSFPDFEKLIHHQLDSAKFSLRFSRFL